MLMIYRGFNLPEVTNCRLQEFRGSSIMMEGGLPNTLSAWAVEVAKAFVIDEFYLDE